MFRKSRGTIDFSLVAEIIKNTATGKCARGRMGDRSKIEVSYRLKMRMSCQSLVHDAFDACFFRGMPTEEPGVNPRRASVMSGCVRIDVWVVQRGAFCRSKGPVVFFDFAYAGG